MTVAKILKTKGQEVVTLQETESVSRAIELMKKFYIGAVLVMGERGRIAGVLSERDVVRALPTHKKDILKTPVSELMTKDVIVCAPDDPIEIVMGKMTNRRIRHLPVLNGKKLVGLISIGDVVKERIAETENEAKALKDYITAG